MNIFNEKFFSLLGGLFAIIFLSLLLFLFVGGGS